MARGLWGLRIIRGVRGLKGGRHENFGGGVFCRHCYPSPPRAGRRDGEEMKLRVAGWRQTHFDPRRHSGEGLPASSMQAYIPVGVSINDDGVDSRIPARPRQAGRSIVQAGQPRTKTPYKPQPCRAYSGNHPRTPPRRSGSGTGPAPAQTRPRPPGKDCCPTRIPA